jgi:hypothetical protein
MRTCRSGCILGYLLPYQSNIQEDNVKKASRISLLLPTNIVQRLRTAARRRSRKELRHVSMGNVVADALLAYLRPRKRRGRRAAGGDTQ